MTETHHVACLMNSICHPITRKDFSCIPARD